MKAITAFLTAMSLACAGCGQKSTPTAPAATGGSLSMPTLAQGVPAPPDPASVGKAAAGGQGAAAVVPPAIDFATGNRPNDANGRPLSDLEWLNQIVQGHLMQATMPDAALPPGRFNTQDEEIAARMAAMEKKQKAAMVRDLSDLVRAGVIKAIPAAPPGKKYVLDQKTGLVVMADQR